MTGLGGSSFCAASADDDAGGIVVGAFCITGRLYYQDRPQSQQFYATTEDKLRAMAADRKSRLISENPLIYRTDEWTLRIYQ